MDLMLLESSQKWILNSWVLGSTEYLHKEFISLSPQHNKYESYSFLPSTLDVEFFPDSVLETGLSMFSRPREIRKQGGLEGS